jgi:hypothetical protein
VVVARRATVIDGAVLVPMVERVRLGVARIELNPARSDLVQPSAEVSGERSRLGPHPSTI